MVTISTTQDMLDLQEEINRIGLYKVGEHRNFYLAPKVQGELMNPIDIEQTGRCHYICINQGHTLKPEKNLTQH